MTARTAGTDLSTDILIAGGGLVGLSLGIGLARAGFEVAVVDAQTPAEVLDPDFDGRSSAIAYASAQLLKALEIWPHVAKDAQPIEEIRVSDGPSRLFVHFDQDAMGDGPLGYMLENRRIRYGLHEAAKDCAGLKMLAPVKVDGIDQEPAFAVARLSDGRRVKARLAIAADGRGSPLRQAAGIKTVAWQYKQAGIVATVQHEYPHHGIAHERFLPAGPFAILPLTQNRSSLVWTAEKHLAPTIMDLPQRSFDSEVRRRFGDFMGDVEVLPKRWSYPLGFHLSAQYVQPRFALIGDAAHGIHPIAGQGLNMGLRDVAAMVEVLAGAGRTGQDIGDPAVLKQYERWRRTDNVVLGAVTDGLNRLFSNNIAPVRIARDVGLGVVNKIPPLKKFFISHARGTVGKLPKLLRGQPV